MFGEAMKKQTTYPVGTVRQNKFPQKRDVDSKNKVIAFKNPEDLLTELLRNGARKLITDVVEADLHEYTNSYGENSNSR